MNWKETILIFSPPSWPVLLTGVAGGLILYELAHLLWGLWRGRGLASAIGATLALALGPVTALAAAVFAGGGASARPAGSAGGAAGGVAGATGQRKRRRGLALSALRFTFLSVLAGAIVRWRLEGAVAAITACAALWAMRAYARTTSDLHPAWKAAFLTLRILAVLTLGLWAMGPQLEYPTRKEVRRAVLIGVDLSSSMQRRDVRRGAPPRPGADGPPPMARIEAVQEALDAAVGELDRLAAEADVRIFGFSIAPETLASLPDKSAPRIASPLASSLELPPATGRSTALGDSAQAAADEIMKQGAELAGIVLISDGCNNAAENVTPEKFASRMAMCGVPIHTVQAGSDQVSPSTHNLNVQDLSAADQVQAFNRLPIRATVEAFGLQGKRLRVSYRFGNEGNAPSPAGGEANSVQVFTVTEPRQSFTAQFVHVPLSSGYQRLIVRAECLNPPEALAGQFLAEKLVQVVDPGLRILYLEGVYRYEVKFLTQALSAGGRFSVDRRIMLQPLSPDRPSPLGEDLDDWLRYHAILLGDLSADSLTPKQQELIKLLVGTYGKGLCMIGGGQSFGRGGWEKTPLADVLPVDLRASTEQIEQELRVVPTAEGLSDPMMAIGREAPGGAPTRPVAGGPPAPGSAPAAPAATGGAAPGPTAPGSAGVAAAWDELSVLPGANLLAGVKPGAAVLATTGDARKHPLIVAQRYGAGRSLAIAFDTTWLWVTTKDTGELQRRFWRQVALYLCDPKGNAWVTTDKPRYDLARLREGKEIVEISGGVEDTQGSPMPEAPVQLTLTGPDGKGMPLQLAPQDHRRVAHLSAVQLAAPGAYSLKLQTQVAGKPLQSECRFDVQERDLEALDVLANTKLLQRLALETKGQFVPLSGLRELLGSIRVVSAAPRVVEQIEHFDLGSYFRWPVILAVLGLLCLEWAIRKRRGLV
jgi:uncharacterized membrane protein